MQHANKNNCIPYAEQYRIIDAPNNSLVEINGIATTHSCRPNASQRRSTSTVSTCLRVELLLAARVAHGARVARFARRRVAPLVAALHRRTRRGPIFSSWDVTQSTFTSTSASISASSKYGGPLHLLNMKRIVCKVAL